ncbi:hypothetical protein U1Q18_028930 [Sarracenia purpurea var. burkii]
MQRKFRPKLKTEGEIKVKHDKDKNGSLATGEVKSMGSEDARIGVRFDKPIPDGVDLGGLCEGGHGFFCNVNDIRLGPMGLEDLDKLLINTLFEAVFSESRNSPFILFMKDPEKSIVGNSESCSTFKSRLEKLPDNTIVIGSHTQTDNRRKRYFWPDFRKFLLLLSHPGGLLFTKFGSNQTALLDWLSR